MPAHDPDDTTTREPEWWDEIGNEGPKPYETASWTYTTVSAVEDEPEEAADPPWWETIGPTTVAPYKTSSWAFTLVKVEIKGSCEPSEFEDRDDLSCRSNQEWWAEIGGVGPKPYEAAAWNVTTQVVEEVDEARNFDSVSYEAYAPTDSWWESLGGQSPKPYNTAAWTFARIESFELEFAAASKVLFQAFDETYFDRTSLGLILDSGYFGQVGTSVYDEAYFLGDERRLLVKRTISRLMVYDSKASSPGVLGSILQPTGVMGTDSPTASEGVITDPDESSIELTRQTTENDDTPPGVLLGSVSYEIFDGILTITDWEHLNWGDDAPVLMGVKTLLSQVPDGITEIRVLDPPHAFWTSLGFLPDYKGDPYLHIHL